MKQWFIVDLSDFKLDYPVYKKFRSPYLFFYFVQGGRETIGPFEYSLQRTTLLPSHYSLSNADQALLMFSYPGF